MAFIAHARALSLPTRSRTTFTCPPRTGPRVKASHKKLPILTMSDGRNQSLLRVSSLGLAVGIALSLSLSAPAAASVLRVAHPRLADPPVTHHSSSSQVTQPATAILIVEDPTEPHPQQVVSSPHRQLTAVPHHPHTPATRKPLQRQATSNLDHAHTSLGQRIADNLRAQGLPDQLVVFLISALPVVELRAGVPVGFFLKLHPINVFLLAVLGNLAPIIPLMLLLRLQIVQTLASRVLDRARKKAASVGNSNSRAAALALFVGIPLPGTGAWTGSLVAFVLGMPIGQSLVALGAGVVMAACIMTALCAMGKVGAVFAGTVLLGAGISSLLRANAVLGDKRDDVGASEDVAETS